MKVRELEEGFWDDVMARGREIQAQRQAGQTKFVPPSDVVRKFEQVGNSINSAIFTPGSALHRALRANPDFKQNLEDMVLDLLRDVQNKIVYADADQLENLLKRPLNLITDNELQAAFLGHIDINDPNLPDNFRQTVTGFLQKQKENFDMLLRLWVQLAVAERQAGQPASAQSLSVFQDWVRNAVRLINKMKFAPAAGKQQPGAQRQAQTAQQGQAGKEPGQKQASVYRDLEAAHDAGAKALDQALRSNPNLTPDQQRQIYDRAARAFKA